MIEDAERLTVGNTKLKLVVAFNYGGRQELVRAVHKLAKQVRDGQLDPLIIDVDMLTQNLDTADMPDPDLLIRTGGEERISNFLLWQCAYTEFVFVPEYWPEFNAEIFSRAIEQFNARERRFGGIKAQSA